MSKIKIGGVELGGGAPLAVIAGLCIIENETHTINVAERLKKITDSLKMPFIFKCSYDKANRSSISSYRGIGMKKGLSILKKVKETVGCPILTDVHKESEVAGASEVADMLQIPAFLCRQTDFVIEVAKSGKVVNVKKGQFLAPWDVKNIVEKIVESGNEKITLTERGASFGYNNLVTDLRSLAIMREWGYPVIFDATHSVQLPGGLGKATGGQRQFVPVLARGAVAAGVDGVFFETHEDPEKALCDGPNCIALDSFAALLESLKEIDITVKKYL